MFESGLPRQFWADSIVNATHIVNKLPSPKLQWKTPFEILYKRPPSYDNLSPSGCLCFASNFNPHKSKFDPRAYKCVFLGYAQCQKGYKVFDIDNKVTLISRDVVFHETIFPYLTSGSSPEPDSIIIPTPIPNSVPVASLASSSVSPLLPEQGLPPDPSPSPQPQRPHRYIKPPAWLKDFHCHSFFTHHDDSCNLASSHEAFMTAFSTVLEPNHYLQAKGKLEWENAMTEELATLERNNTLEVVDLPKGKKAIGSKWVFKVKLNPDGTVDRYKARSVARGLY
ncbi:UNVERIFIED_CONTAM: Retrovirus-related Pol polyprotein from transposon TNT 1-94 [Sesamum radiatum]|uniref:Retrovirus-related Pol polyprotein from transposon TNT 1-94 n=1 Tax=Sesamum radiatum TaxID=300843 RepID=A0AAW2NQQ4_SESRA